MMLSLNQIFKTGLYISLLSLFAACEKNTSSGGEIEPVSETLPEVSARFTLMSSEVTGIKYSNQFKEDYNYNIYTYEYIYNGCGVAAGDVNGDGLPDLYFATSFGPNRLFLNQGNFTFIDITKVAGVPGLEGFKTGVNMADVNGDGRLDLYSCRTSKTDDGLKTNFLYINMGNKPVGGKLIPYFEEQAVELGLDDNSDSNQACFFDFDRDGDLDVFILNHRIGFKDAGKLRVREQPDGSVKRITTPETPFESNQLFRNDNGKFVDVTEKAGLLNSAFGLSVTPMDMNKDGWMDLYVANDFVEPDHIYINNGNGTFTDHYYDYLRHSSQNSMGSDLADINNDGLNDIIVVDMKAEDPFRYKELAHGMVYDRYNLLVQYDYGRQVVRNVLQINNGNDTYSEIGQYAGIDATDWSWAPLIADFDNDGWKDIYITNGYRRDITNLDYMNYVRDSLERTGGVTPRRFPDIYEVLKHIPEKKLNNYLYINSGNLSFINASKQAGMDHLSFSNGAAYADLDQDGDLDLIVNNLDEPVFIYRNDIANRNWLQITVTENDQIPVSYGTTAELYAGGTYQYQVLNTLKGFLSSSEPLIHFGLGTLPVVDSLIITWPSGDKEIMRNVTVNQRLNLKKGSGQPYTDRRVELVTPIFSDDANLGNWIHQENSFVDFKTEKLIPYMLSAEGPCLSVADLNGDGLDDVFAGNGAGAPASVFMQNASGQFTKASLPALERDASYEDCGAVFEDFDADGDLDMIVISGGHEQPDKSTAYKTRHYLNDGQGAFSPVNDFPDIRSNAGVVKSFDYDADGDMDVIIGGRSVPGRFPTAPESFLLKNEQGKFTNVTQDVFPALKDLGMITDIEVADLNGDGQPEVVFSGEWMPVTVYSWDGKGFTDQTKAFGFEKTNGWWKAIEIADIDQDGDPDIIAGNMGLNHRLKASVSQPVTLITNDFDNNGFLDPIMCFYYNGKLFPYAGRDAIIAQIPRLKKKFTRYKPYTTATVEDIFTKSELSASTYHYTYTFETTLFVNEGGKFSKQTLPYQVQLHPTNDIIIHDFDRNGKPDILCAGNFLYAETETAELDAGNGTLLLQNADGSFSFEENRKHGFWASDEVRELKLIKRANGKSAVLVGNNNGPIQIRTMVNQ